MNCIKRFENAIVRDEYMVFIRQWENQSDFAAKIIKIFNETTKRGGCGPEVEPMINWPTNSYLSDMPRLFMLKRYGWELAHDYRQWCKDNPGEILTIEVFGSPEAKSPTSFMMKYEKGFKFKLF